jgi:hypothetical protein
MSKYSLIFVVFISTLCLSGCGGSSSSSDDSADTETTTDASGNFDSDLFGSALISEDVVSCTLENGSETTCYELTFSANGVGDTEGNGTIGPYCPEYITTPRNESGVGIYDGTTDPGFQSLVDAAIAMDTDGYDIVDDDGFINFNDLTTTTDQDLSYCLSAVFDSTLEITYLVPVTPEVRSEPYTVPTVGSFGIGISGVPFKGNPPSVTTAEAGIGGTGSGNIPALDLCGGHADPAGYYHWHFIPQSMNTVLASDEYDYTAQYDMSCSNSNVAFDEPSAFAGIAKDGYPIYAAFDSVDSVDTTPSEVADLDECNGHTHATSEFPDGVYHYHALENGAPNIPSCLTGSFVSNDFSVR